MHLEWGNGYLDVGRLWCRDAVGIELAWGRRDLMGEDVREGETILADHRVIVFASGLDIRRHGSAWRGAMNRWLDGCGPSLPCG